MLHNEHLSKADELYECRHDNNGNAIHVYIKDGKAQVFPTLDDFIRKVYTGDTSVEHFEADEIDLEELYNSDTYSYSELLRVYLELLKSKVSVPENDTVNEEEVELEQLQLQHELQGLGFNIVTCGNCDSVLIHRTKTDSVNCYCGTMELSDCPDLNYTKH